jgi:hypothetical protein
MKTFVTIVLICIVLTFLVVTNAAMVPLRFYSLSMNVALPFILVFPTGIALLAFAFFHELQMGKATTIIHGLEDDLQHEQDKVLEIVRRTHELELENRKLKIRLGDAGADTDEDSM